MRIAVGVSVLIMMMGTAFAQTARQGHVDADTFRVVNVGNLMRLCSASEEDPMAKQATEFCLGLVVGAYGVYDEFVRGDRTAQIVCPPLGVTRIDGAKIFVDWARANPQAHNEPAIDGLFRAWSGKYPCPRAQRP